MTTESAEHNQSIGQLTGESIAQGLAMRQSWQPMATQKTGALMANIGQRTAPMLENVLRVSDWYKQFTRRVQPWSGWTAMPLAFPSHGLSPHETEPSSRSAAAKGVTKTTLATTTDVQPHTTDISRVGASIDRSTVIPQRLSRPAVRLSTLRVGGDTALTQPNFSDRTAGSQRSSPSLPVHQITVGDRLLFPSFPTAEQPQMAPRLVLNIAPNPRREVQGGFPTRPLPLGASVQPKVTDEPGSLRRLTLPVAVLPVEPEILPDRIISPNDVPTLAAQVVSPEPEELIDQESAIAKLIANSFLPVPMPGLEIRMASPTAQANSTQATQPIDNSSSTAFVPPPPPPAPQLNINEIADKVYQTLQRRQQFERERRGLH